MKIEIDKSFASNLLRDYTMVSNDVVQVVRTLIPGAPPRGEREIVCVHDERPIAVPFVQWPSPSPTQYKIWLACVGERDYCKLAYQLAHELGHVMMDPSRDNGAIEMLAMAVSLQALTDLAAKWATNPPHPSWKGFAGTFLPYREVAVAGVLGALPGKIQDAARNAEWDIVAQYLIEQRKVMDEKPCERPLNVLGALYLMAKGLPWHELRGLAGKTVPAFEVDPSFQLKAPFVPAEIPDWLVPIWADT
jgi:hypothetical protein